MRARWYLTGLFLLLAAGSWCAAADVRAPAGPDELDQRIAALIAQLGDDEFATRQRAQEALVALGFDAFDALCEAENSDDPEIAMQAGYLVRLIRVEWTDDADPRSIQLILKDYDAQNDERRLLRIRQLADLPLDIGLPWLCRLVRFEKSQVLSKQAALAIIKQDLPADDAAWNRRAAVITKAIERSRRPVAGWLLTYVQAHGDPAEALAAWTALAQAELKTLDEHPQETSSQVVMDLLRRKIELLDRLGRGDEIPVVMRQMVGCERGDSASLGELVDWLAQRKAWNIIDEVAARFAASFELDAMLLYTLCEARLAQGSRPLADQAAEKALKLNGENVQEHLEVVRRLMDRGLTEWSDRELRYVITLGPIASPAAVKARMELADSLHDRLRDREAGEVLKALMDAADSDANVLQQIRLLMQSNEKKDGYLRARMNFYFACHAGSQNDDDAKRGFLDKAIEQDPSDLDVLIALYRLPGDEPARRERLSKLIKAVVDECRSAIEDSPEEPVNYNELAWLVANTEGDVDEAIRLSQKSVEIVRAAATNSADSKRVGQYLDTLGHCYFAKKDYAGAVKYQSEAVKLDPHTKAISRQLDVFKNALAGSQSGGK